jgi:hypothetical protein
LPRDKSSVCYHQWINRPNSPSLLWISKAWKYVPPPMSNQEKYRVWNRRGSRNRQWRLSRDL